MKILVTAGPTREAIDPIRYITNHSSGKMGYAIAEALIRAGAEVILVSGPVLLTPPDGLLEFVPVISAADMAEAVRSRFPACGGVVMCAAVADYRPAVYSQDKMKKKDGDLCLRLERTEDILLSLGKMKKSGQILLGFAAETKDLRAYALDKMEKKNLDWIAANQVGVPGRGCQADDNAVTLYSRSGEVIDFPLTDKKSLAEKIVSAVFHI